MVIEIWIESLKTCKIWSEFDISVYEHHIMNLVLQILIMSENIGRRPSTLKGLKDTIFILAIDVSNEFSSFKVMKTN